MCTISSGPFRACRALAATLVALAITLGSPLSHAQPAPSPASGNPFAPPAAADPAVEAEVRSARRWATWGVGVPLAAGVAFAVATEPGGKEDVPDWQIGVLVGLFGAPLTWGVSMGYYKAGQPVYATLSGAARAAVVVGAVVVDRAADYEGPPVATVAALGVAVGYSIYDYRRLGPSIRERARGGRVVTVGPVPVFTTNGGLGLGLAGRF